MLGLSQELTKVKIESFEDEECKTTKSSPNEIELQINPDNISHDHGIKFFDDDLAKYEITGIGNTPKNPTLESQVIRFDFYLDGTGVVDEDTDVSKVLEKFKKVCYYYHGKTHGPPYLKLTWGKLFTNKNKAFKCRLKYLNVNYLEFLPDGTPVRAKLDCQFEQHISAAEAQKIMNKSSPDLSHLKMIHKGDNLPLLCNDVYNDPNFYQQVAKVNKLSSIFQLKPGKRILMPPIK